MSDNRPIGVLDSGVGGLSVTKELIKVLPKEKIVYFADSKNCPYGTKTLAEIRENTTKMVDFLIKKKCKMVIFACNSITSTLIEEFRLKYRVPFVGIEPATLVAARKTKKGKIGVLVTKATAKSKLFNKTKESISAEIEVSVGIGEGMVELVERGILEGKEAEKIVLKNVLYFKEKGVDQLVLGCTHYPFLVKTLKKIAPEINFLDSATGVATRTKDILELNKLENKDTKEVFYEFYFSQKALGWDILLKEIDFKGTKKLELTKF